MYNDGDHRRRRRRLAEIIDNHENRNRLVSL